MDTIRQLVDRHDARTRQLLILDRLSLVANHVFRRPGMNLIEVRSPSPSCRLTLQIDAVKHVQKLWTWGKAVIHHEAHFQISNTCKI